jgi:hypothetical protein
MKLDRLREAKRYHFQILIPMPGKDLINLLNNELDDFAHE